MRLIDADAIETKAIIWNGEIEHVVFRIDNAPTVDAVPVRHGRWTADESMYTVGEAQCSMCKTTFYEDDLYMVGEKAQSEMPNYCPHCGAKMDAEREEK